MYIVCVCRKMLALSYLQKLLDAECGDLSALKVPDSWSADRP